MTLARVFPRRTEASPRDALAFFGLPKKAKVEALGITEAHVSVAFTFDLERAKKLAEAWSKIVPTKIGGVALGDPGGEFVPGRYLKPGYVITSRGCPNKCWFCDVHKREGRIPRELPITEGFNLLDSNILACSEAHIRAVFKMLGAQKERAQFTGGLEAARLEDWHVDLLWDLGPDQMFFAYDTPDDFEPLVAAGEKLRYANFTRSHMRCYVLAGYASDTYDAAVGRCIAAWKAGFMPMMMVYRDKENKEKDHAWGQLQRTWCRPPSTKAEMKRIGMTGPKQQALL